jgi:NitT/TauT family transport system ATP-binding protein
MTMKTVAIHFAHVSKRFTSEARGEVWAVRDLNLHCEAGKVTCLVGPSGCGKTTLLRLAAGLDRPTTGRVFMNGETIAGPTAGIGLLSQEGDLLPWRRVIDNIAMGLELRGVPRAERHAQARRVLEQVHLPPEVARSHPHELSGGMRQRVALARALCHNPRVLLMDEPFASLDEQTRERLHGEFIELWQSEPRTVLLVTHSVEEAVLLADRVVVMAAGRLTADLAVAPARPRDVFQPDMIELLRRVRSALKAKPKAVSSLAARGAG